MFRQGDMPYQMPPLATNSRSRPRTRPDNLARLHLFRFADEHRLYIGDLLGDTVAHLGYCLLGGRFYIEDQFAQVLDLVLRASYLGTNFLTTFCVLVSSGGDLRVQIALSSFCRRIIFAASAPIRCSSCMRVFIVKIVFVDKTAQLGFGR